ncbi:hypothetical protein D0869_15888, partial [Hortaea werneckii]
SAKSVRRPPSPSYLREKTSGDVREGTEGGAVAPPKREKRGLMSRKMMLLRSKTASNTNLKGEPQSTIPRSVPTPTSDKPLPDPGPTLASSPTLMDVGNLAPPTPGPEQSEDKRLSASASSFNSEDMAGIPSFLSRYDTNDGATTDEDLTDTDSPTAQSKLGYSVRIEGGLEAERRQQEEEEQNSAMLSKRAEQILANAKKRLNLMEGNLRGARDLVAPLTAANLKRATSLGSAQQSPYNPSTRDRFASTMYSQDQGSPRRSSRILHAQASSPTIGRDYQGHARGFSETQIPERPHTALGRSNGPLRKGRIPVKANDGSWAQSLRSSRSYDSLGAQNGAVRPASQDAHPLHVRGSPDPALAPLPEDEDTTQQESYPSGRKSEISVETDKQDALGIYRPASRTEDLREQMSSLKGRISSLRDRAREDSLKRQSLQSIRAPTPLNNAVSEPPEFYYGQAQSYSGPLPGSNSGVGKISPKDSPISPQFSKRSWEQKMPTPPGRNAFAQQAAIQGQQQRSLSPEKRGVASNVRQLASDRGTVPETTHRRTPSGTAIVASAANRYSHHEAYKHHLPAPTASDNDISPFPTNEPPTPDYDNPVSPPSTDIDGASVYDDAPTEQPPVVAHEDRDDAFDYEHFFLHSAMGTYGRRGLHGRQHSSSSSDDRDSASSASTAKPGPEEHFNPESGFFPPPTPETPERLREIERNLQHKRTESSDSVSTVDSFATAAEASSPPLPTLSREVSNMGWPIPPSDNFSRPSSRPSSRPGSRPGTANKRAPEKQPKDNDSERADSGVGLPRRSGSGRSVKKIAGGLAAMPPRSSAHTATSTTTPPISPHQTTLHDPATVAVNALLKPDGKPLGLKDKAVLFGLVESLRRVCGGLQHEEEEGQGENWILRRRLDEAKKVLDGVSL